jgi:hypothetical protein
MFLVELLVTILYNYSKNICYMEENWWRKRGSANSTFLY